MSFLETWALVSCGVTVVIGLPFASAVSSSRKDR